MVDIFAIKGAIDGLKAARDIAKTAIGLRDAVMLQSKVIELNDVILSAQSSALDAQAEQLAMAKRIDDLERQIAQTEAWDREKVRYQLTELPPGVLVYAVKEEARGIEPPHYVCANCFEQRRKSFLNKDESNHGQTKLHCPACGWEDKIGHWQRPNVEGGPRGGGPNDWMGR
jgi:DNA-directed RNA polymerase subunit RPC12/RpoP